MAVHNFAGDAMRGATWVSLHNGGGVGWGEAINGGFGLLLDGSESCDRRIDDVLFWDVVNGIARRSWAGNPGAERTAAVTMKAEPRLRLTMPAHADAALVERAVAGAAGGSGRR